jgi:hypothetical protein
MGEALVARYSLHATPSNSTPTPIYPEPEPEPNHCIVPLGIMARILITGGCVRKERHWQAGLD